MASDLEANLAEYQAESNGKLPSIRGLMRKYSASQATVERSLFVLSEKGLIKPVPGKGVFVTQATEKESDLLNADLCFFFEKKTLYDNPLYSQMITAMLQYAAELGMHLNVFSYGEMGGVDEFKRRLNLNSQDGVILMCVMQVNYELLVKHMGKPVLLLFPNAHQDDSTCVWIDGAKGIHDSVEYLQKLGHKRIAYLHGQGFHGYYHLHQEKRIEAFYSAMREFELPVPPPFVQYGGFDEEEGYEAAKKLLAETYRPTAIVCNDYNATGVYKAAADAGLKIPGDLSVIGFDDLVTSAHKSPPLTTVNIQWREIAKLSLQMISDMVKGKVAAGTKVSTPIKLVVRDSTAVPPDIN